MIMLTITYEYLRHVTEYLRFNHEQKSLKVPFVIHVDTKFLFKKIFTYDNNLQKSYTSKINKDTT